MKKAYYLEDLKEDAIEDLDEEIEYLTKEEETYDIDDLITEVADNNIPIYTYDLLQYASNNFDLIQPSDLTSDNPDVTQIITMNIYELLTDELYQHIRDWDFDKAGDELNLNKGE